MKIGIDKKEAIAVGERLTGERPRDVSFPGGKGRDSVRLHFDSHTRILTKRPAADRTRREAEIVRTLHDHGAPVPDVHGFDGLWMLQEDLGGNRLSYVLNNGDPIARASAMEAAVVSMADCHEAARRAEPVNAAHMLGFRRDWIEKLVTNPTHIGRRIEVPAPTLDAERLVPFLRVRTAQLIKWDARPGNAMIRETGPMAGACTWFDWEHCGRRNPPDDLAWILADEFMPEDPASEIDILERHIERFAAGFGSKEEALLYFLAFGTFHMTVRLELILYRRLRDGRWWDFGYCMKGDKIGVAETCVHTLCSRGSRWSKANPLTAPLSGWFADIADFVRGLDKRDLAAE